MKKLLVFFSIFAVLFVSTIRPLQAEQLTDPFTLENGRTYYFIIYEDFVEDDLLISTATNNNFNLRLFNPNGLSNLDNWYILYTNLSNNATQTFPLTFVGYATDYSIQGNPIANALVFSFTYNGILYNQSYDDYGFAFDTENVVTPISIYDTIYSLVNKFVFGNNIESGSHQDLTATILSTTICVLVFALPFLIIWKVIKIIMG